MLFNNIGNRERIKTQIQLKWKKWEGNFFRLRFIYLVTKHLYHFS